MPGRAEIPAVRRFSAPPRRTPLANSATSTTPPAPYRNDRLATTEFVGREDEALVGVAVRIAGAFEQASERGEQAGPSELNLGDRLELEMGSGPSRRESRRASSCRLREKRGLCRRLARPDEFWMALWDCVRRRAGYNGRLRIPTRSAGMDFRMRKPAAGTAERAAGRTTNGTTGRCQRHRKRPST